MVHSITYKRYTACQVCLLCILLLAFAACKKTDDFYDKLKALPQIDYSKAFAYKAAYIIGDTMVITGNLNPESNLQITIGGEAATIIKTDSVKSSFGVWLDQVAFLITDGMQGKAREVKITSGGYSVSGAAVDIYTPGGLGSFNQRLKSVLVKTFTNGNQHVFLHCQNGKGDVYYYDGATKELKHVKKDGTETTLFGLMGSIGNTGQEIITFLAGGVDPQGQHVYFSAKTSASGYIFCKIDLINKQLTVLNQSQEIGAPYEGDAGAVKMIVSGVYPDSKGQVYLAIGFNQRDINIPDALARYNEADHKISYIYKRFLTYNANTYVGMPGTEINTLIDVVNLRFSPDENLLYVMGQVPQSGTAVYVYDLDARIKLYSFSPSPFYGIPTVIGPFASLQPNLSSGVSPDGSFGFLPMPGKRLQVLMFQFLDGVVIGSGGQNIGSAYDFPKWIVFDFNEQRAYEYAPGKFDRGEYIFQPTTSFFPRSPLRDEVLNYDEEGNLYATANGKAALIKTQAN